MSHVQQWFEHLASNPDAAFGFLAGMMGLIVFAVALHCLVFFLCTVLALVSSVQEKWKRAAWCLVYPLFTVMPFAFMGEPISICLTVGFGYWFYRCLKRHKESKSTPRVTIP